MCRWLAYSGSPLLLEEALYGGANSLIDQSLLSRLGAEPTNGDGFGVGWYGDRPTPGVYHSIEPAWNDRNLRELAGHISSPLFFTHIRAAIGSAVQQTNCHPFRHDRWLFMHNGYINEFSTIKRDLALAVLSRDHAEGGFRGGSENGRHAGWLRSGSSPDKRVRAERGAARRAERVAACAPLAGAGCSHVRKGGTA